MNKADAFLYRVRAKNAKLFAADKIQIKPGSLEALLRQAFEEGEKAGKETIPLFDSIFGK